MYFSPRQRKIIEAKEPKILCLSSAASGKALPNSTKIPTTDGWKEVRDIRPGDYLYDKNGKPTKVLNIFPQGKLEVFLITFGDGRTAKCSKDHIWYVNKPSWKNKNDFREYTVEQMISSGLINSSRGANFYIPCSMAIEKDEKEYKIHPYVVGAFLGDGCCKESKLTISSNDKEIPERIAKLLGDNIKAIKLPSNNYSWNFINNINNDKLYTSILPKELINYSYDKSIPEEYKNGSIEQRLELIRGLFDTDGNISKDNRDDHSSTANVRFSSTSYQLVIDIKDILGSLGYVSTIREDNRKNKYTKGICYELCVNIPNSEKEKLFNLKRKKDIAISIKDKKQNRNYDRTSIRSIEDLGYEEEMTCFLVDNDEHLFLMNDYIVTHNTRVLTERIRYLITECNVNESDIVAITFTNMSAEEMKTRLKDCCKNMFIGTIHSYANKICYLNGVSTSEDIQTADFDKILKKVIRINPKRYPKIKYLLIDECQDLGNLEHIFIRKIPTENIFYCGDFKQLIYSFRGVSGDYVKDLYYDTDFKKYSLIDNYRNPPNIINFANSFIDRYQEQFSPSSSPVKTQDGIIEECSFYDALDELEESEEWGSWFILTRTNNELYKAQEILDKRDIPNLTFKTGDLTLSQLKAFMGANKVKILTIHTSKGLSLKNVIVVGARTYNDEERRICYVAATRAENALYWCPSIAGRRGSVNKKNRDFTKEEGVINF